MLVVSREITVVEERIPKVQKGDPEGRGHNTRGASRPRIQMKLWSFRIGLFVRSQQSRTSNLRDITS